jgi:hypothetical protein
MRHEMLPMYIDGRQLGAVQVVQRYKRFLHLERAGVRNTNATNATMTPCGPQAWPVVRPAPAPAIGYPARHGPCLTALLVRHKHGRRCINAVTFH